MTLYSPFSLFFLLSVPAVILLYMLKRKHAEYRVPSLYLWQQVMKEMEAGSPWQRLKKNLLLALQILALLLLVFAMTRPSLDAGGKRQKSIVILLDRSLSMQAVDYKPSRFEAAKKEITGYLQKLSPGTGVTLISVGEHAVIEESRSTDKKGLADKVRKLEPGYGTADFEDASALVQSISGTSPDTEVVVYGDRRPDMPGVEVKFVSFAREGDNHAVTLLSQRASGEGISVLGRITNYSLKEASIPVSLYADGKLFDARNVTAGAGKSANIYWNNVPGDTAWLECRIDAADSLAADNSMWEAVNRSRDRKVLYAGTGNTFIEKAVALQSGIQLYKAAPGEAAGLSGYDIYIFDGFLPAALPADGGIIAFNPPQSGHFPVSGEAVQPRARKADHEIMNYIEDGDIYIYKSSLLHMPDWGHEVITSQQGTLAYAGRKDGRRVLVFGFDVRSTDMILRPAFPVLISNAVEWLAPSGANRLVRAYAGQAVELDIHPMASEVSVIGPDSSAYRLLPPFDEGMYDRTDIPGIYRFEQKLPDGTGTSLFAVNVPAEKESNLKNTESTETAKTGTSGAAAGAAGYSLVPVLLWLTLLLLLVEWWFYTYDSRI